VEQRGQQLDLPAADAQLPHPAAAHRPLLLRAARVHLEQRTQVAVARRLRSSSDAPPFPYITPSTETCVVVVSFMSSSFLSSWSFSW
jgi:hypothetical protein